MKIKLYLKSSKKPIILIGKNILDILYKEIRTSDMIKIGPVIFRREDFIYAVEVDK